MRANSKTLRAVKRSFGRTTGGLLKKGEKIMTKKKEYKPKKNLMTTVPGAVFAGATAAAPFFPQYSLQAD